MKKYILLHPDEDSNIVTWIGESELKDIIGFKEDYGVERFIDSFPDGNSDPQYWGDGDAMLLEVTIKKVVPVKVVEKYEIK